MNKMGGHYEKIRIFMLSVLVCFLAIPASAMTETTNDIEKYAYMEFETAPEVLQPKILEARSDIIFNTSWIADDLNAYVIDEEGNIVEELPHFSEVFPNDWDIPVFPVNKIERTVMPLDDEIMQFTYDEWLTYPSEEYVTPPFCTVSTLGFPGTSAEYHVRWIATNATYTVLPSDATYNLAYTDADTGRTLGSKIYIGKGAGLRVEFPYDSDYRVNIHASTFDQPGDWIIFVGFQMERP